MAEVPPTTPAPIQVPLSATRIGIVAGISAALTLVGVGLLLFLAMWVWKNMLSPVS